jgi:pyrroloquinoline quinone (PQQ) biosynthesis protein C
VRIDPAIGIQREDTVTQTIDNGTRPQLRHCTFFQPDTGPVMMIVGENHFEITQHGADFDAFLNLKRYFDGRHTVGDIAAITGLPAGDVVNVVRTFDDQGLLRVEDAEMADIPVEVFLKQVDKSVAMWDEQIGYNRLWSGLEQHRYRKEVFLGVILETYHYISSASRHISTALSHCTDPQWSHLLSEYLSEEYDHAWMPRESLVRMGLTGAEIESAHPLIGTWSLINNLCEIAREDTLGYLACTMLFEARGAETLDGAHALQRLATDYGYPADCLSPLVSHVEEDVRAEHVGLLEEALQGRTSVPAERAHRAVNNLHDLKHSFDQYHYGIIQYYSDISNYIPRLKVDYFSL